LGGAIGFSTIINDYTRKIHVIPLSSKIHFVHKFKEFVNQNILSRGFQIKIIRSDNGSEIKNYKFNEFLTVLSARIEFSSTYSPESDGVAERAHQTLLSIANTLRIGADFPSAAWAELLHTACFIHSHLPCRSNPGYMSPNQQNN
jgi:transposase InsO family protein